MYKMFVLFPEGPDMYLIIASFSNPNAKWVTASDTFFATAAYSGDLLMAWHLYIIWSRNKRVLYIPVLFFFAGLVGIAAEIVFDVDSRSGMPPPTKAPVTIAVFSITLFLTWYSTILICYRLWSVQRLTTSLCEPGEVRPSRYNRVMWAIVQSGMLYSLLLVAWLMGDVKADINATNIVGPQCIRIIGINSTLIVLQLNMQTFKNNISNDSPPTQRSQGRSLTVFRKISATLGSGKSMEMSSSSATQTRDIPLRSLSSVGERPLESMGHIGDHAAADIV
ncbi:hypothetical protein FRB95_000562 [Tulasnella sp. JGI-2019a]|nr:hypothetical protein FRB95_000562 [Tulasnella sp. JGI-2019a]